MGERPKTIETRRELKEAVEILCACDADLRSVYEHYGLPPLWHRKQSLGTLIWFILEQQVSVASARAAYDRLLAKLNPISAEGLLAMSDAELKEVGFSRQKTRYARIVAEAIQNGSLRLRSLARLSDEEVRKKLCSLTGIGPWTAEVYLLMALRRADAFPVGDRALVVAAREVKKLKTDPDPEQLCTLAVPWQPYRAVATRLLWHSYLSAPRQN